MTLAETLMAVLIMSIIFTAVGGGVVVMRNNYEKVTLKAKAQVLIATAISAMNMDLEAATKVKINDSGDVDYFYSSRRNLLMKYEAGTIENDGKETYKGILLIPELGEGVTVTPGGTGDPAPSAAPEQKKYPLVSDRAATDLLYTDFDTAGGLSFDGTNGYFQYTICVKKMSDDKVMETMTIMVSPISPPEIISETI